MVLDSQQILRYKIAQLFIVRASGHALDNQREYPLWELPNDEITYLLGQGVGGVILFGGTIIELQYRCEALRQCSKSPLFICADIEEGVGQRFDGGTWLLPPMSIGKIYNYDPQRAILLAKKYGNCIGFQARKCGLNLVLGPVCDVNNNPLNPVINVRAWSDDPLVTSNLIAAFQKGIESEGVLTCAKHFPGHGDTLIDSHLSLPEIEHDLERLTKQELLPFAAAINEGVSSIMMAHIVLRKLDPLPATFSRFFISDLLRKKFKFKGLVLSDALIMKAITKNYGPEKAAIMAFSAGIDLILMPQDANKAINAISDAIESGLIPANRLEESLQRREEALLKIKYEKSISDKLNPNLERDEDRKLANELLLESLQITNKIYVELSHKCLNIIIIDRLIDSRIITSNAPSILIPEGFDFNTIILHDKGLLSSENSPDESLLIDKFPDHKFFLQIFIRGNPFLGDFSHQKWIPIIDKLVRRNKLLGLVVFGSPYAWDEFNAILPSYMPGAYSPGQMHLSQKQLLEKIFSIEATSEASKEKSFNKFTD